MERPRWNLKVVREHAHRHCPDRRTVLAFVTSLDWSDQIFRYHFVLARDALKRLPVDEDPASIANFELLLRLSVDHSHALLETRANVLACIHTVRNAYEHFAQLCNALLLEPQIPIDECGLYKVRARLPDSELKHELDVLAGSDWFKYIAAYSNTSKHRALVQQNMHLSFAEGVAGVRVEGFTHDKDYPPHMVGDLLEGVLGVKNQIITCGNALNRQLAQVKA